MAGKSAATVTTGVDADFYRPHGPKTLDYKGTRANKPTLVKFGTAWCGACVAYTESGGWRDTIALAKRLGVELRDCDADRHQQALALVAEYSGSDDVGIPLLILFHAPADDDAIAAPVVYDGAMVISGIREWLERHLGDRSASATATAAVAASPASASVASSASPPAVAAAASSRRRRPDTTGVQTTSAHDSARDNGGGDNDDDEDVSDDERRESAEVDSSGGGDSTAATATTAGVTKLVGQREVRDFLEAHRDGGVAVVLQWSVPGCEWCAELAQEMRVWSARYGARGLVFAETDAKQYGASRLEWSRFPVTQVLRAGVERAVVRGYQPETIEDEIDRIAREHVPTAPRRRRPPGRAPAHGRRAKSDTT